jgi:hypothetical protein
MIDPQAASRISTSFSPARSASSRLPRVANIITTSEAIR